MGRHPARFLLPCAGEALMRGAENLAPRGQTTVVRPLVWLMPSGVWVQRAARALLGALVWVRSPSRVCPRPGIQGEDAVGPM